jgi:hypothetical protein
VITRAELDAVASAAPDTAIGHTASTALKHFDFLSRLDNSLSPSGINRDDAQILQKRSDPEQCQAPPSFISTEVVTTAAGAAGGAIGSKVAGGKASSGAGTGAAIGVAAGALDWVAQKSAHDQAVQDRQPLEAWSEFANPVCNGDAPAQATPKQEKLPQDSPQRQRVQENVLAMHNMATTPQSRHLDHPGTDEQSLEQFHRLKKDFASIDTNHDGYLSLSELANASVADKLPADERKFIAVLGNNIGLVSQLGALHAGSSVKISMSDLNAADQLYAKPTSEQVSHHWHMVEGGSAVGAVVGCVVGGLIGSAAASPEIGCPIGAVVLGGAGGVGTHKIASIPDPIGDHLGKENVDNLKFDLRAFY